MAFLPMIINSGGGGGVTTVHPVLIGQFTSSSASAVTRTLTDSITNYQYLWFSMSPITSDSVWLQNTLAYSGYGFVDIDYFRNNTLTLRYTTSPSGTLIARTMTLTYVSDTTLTSQASTSDSRDLYIYGIKDMPSWGNLPTATGTFSAEKGVVVDVNIGFKPKKLCVEYKSSSTALLLSSYDEDISTTQTLYGIRNGSSTIDCSVHNLTDSNNGIISGITNNGFQFRGSTAFSGVTMRYFAIG